MKPERERRTPPDLERKLREAQQALRDSEQRLQNLFEQTLSGIAETDLTGRYLRVNRRYCEITGRSEAELLKLRMQDITHPEDLPRNLEKFRSLAQDRVSGFEIEKRYLRPGRDPIWVHNSVVVVRDADGEPQSLVVTTLDVTERKQSEEALQQARLQQESALLAAEIGTFVWDIEADRLHGDKNFNAHFGIPLEETGAAPLADFAAAVHPDDRPRVLALIEQALESGGEYEAEYRITTGGRERWVIARGKVVRDDENRAVRFPGVLLDITDRKRAEEALREADRRKDEFLATLSHELRNPLAPIRQAVGLLKVPNVAARDAQRARDIIDRQSRHMAWLLEDLLDLSRITRGVLELRKEPLELAALVETAVEAAQPVIESRRHTLIVDLPDRPVTFEADGLRLAQVISNLLTNAAKYTDPGGQIRLKARIQDSDLVFSVRDNGVGISPEMLPRMFRMFSQEKSTLGRSQGGLGIGLALVRGLVELHGGIVEASSAGVGQGSEFTVRLPAVAVTGADAESAAPDRRRAGSARKILVADDNHDAAESMGILLTVAGHEVCTVHDGQAALEAATAFKPDVALIDIGMPKLTGYEVAERVRAAPWGRRVLLIALTGWGQEDDKRHALAAGFDHHLTKPVDQEVLEGLLAEYRER